MDPCPQVSRGGLPRSPYTVEAASTHTHSVILLHGLGSNGEKFGAELMDTAICSDGRRLRDLLPGAKFIFPTAKRRRSSAFSRAKLTQWFDIASLVDPSDRRHTQIQGLEESSKEIRDIINQEASKVSSENVLIGGLSQGSAMAIICLLTLEFPLGGFVGMSGWMPYRDDIQDLVGKDTSDNEDDDPFGDEDNPFVASEKNKNEQQEPIMRILEFVRDLVSFTDFDDRNHSITSRVLSTPVFFGHGKADEKIVPRLGEDARDTMEDIGFKVTWKAYDGQGHWYKIPDEVNDIVDFIRANVGWTLE